MPKEKIEIMNLYLPKSFWCTYVRYTKYRLFLFVPVDKPLSFYKFAGDNEQRKMCFLKYE